jgi:thioredoxin reductase (NADPH)
MTYDLIIIGSGAAGLSAGIYAGRFKLRTLVIGKEFGGETATAWTIENYPGIPAVDGYDLVSRMREQAKVSGAEMAEGEVESIQKVGHCFTVMAGGKEYQSKSLILALGTNRRKLGLPNEAELVGKGVHYCATCDAPLYHDKIVGIVGGGDASVKGAILAGMHAKKVYLITRESELHAEPANLEQMKRLGDKVEVIYDAAVSEISPKEYGVGLQSVTLSSKGNLGKVSVDGLFVEIGAEPNVDLAVRLGVELDDKGYIKVDNLMRTNIDGVFAAGDATNHFGAFKQDITAAATGAVAAASAFKDLGEHGATACEMHARARVEVN